MPTRTVRAARLREYLAPILEAMTDAELNDYTLSITWLCQKLSERWATEQLGESRQQIAERYRAGEIRRRKEQK